MTNPPNSLNTRECIQLYDFFFDRTKSIPFLYTPHRNLLMFLLMLDAGLRVGELVQLRIDDLYNYNTVLESVVVRPEISKSKRSRTIPLSMRCRCVIEIMWQKSWLIRNGHASVWAFWAMYRHSCITPRTVERMIQAASTVAIGRPITPHWLRHTFATRLMKTTNIRVVQTLLGHRSLQSTQVYTHPGADDLKTAIENME